MVCIIYAYIQILYMTLTHVIYIHIFKNFKNYRYTNMYIYITLICVYVIYNVLYVKYAYV